MTKITIDRRLADQLRATRDPVLLVDDAGQPAAVVHPEPLEQAYVNPIDGSPFTEEELLRRARKSSGRPLSAIFADLGVR